MLFQSPYGGIGASDFTILILSLFTKTSFNHLTVAMVLQTSLDSKTMSATLSMFQSPYGGKGASDRCS